MVCKVFGMFAEGFVVVVFGGLLCTVCVVDGCLFCDGCTGVLASLIQCANVVRMFFKF